MNTTTAPTQTTRIEADALHQFAQATACAVGIPASQAVLLADLLTAADLRANKTHGTRQLTRYVNEITSDRLNPTPMITTVKETPVSLVLDGDGGLGYFPAHAGTLRIIEKAQTSGMAALVCRHHGHIGAAGHYPRLTLGHDLICFCTSGHQLNLEPGRSAHAAAGGSPMAFSAPADREPPLVLDIGVTHGIQGSSPGRDTILATDPAVVLRAIGLGTICQAWGGLLSGLSLEVPKDRRYSAANQGTFLFACRVDLFHDPAEYRRKIDLYQQKVRQLAPLPHVEAAHLPGDPEAQREADYAAHGIPLPPDHLQQLRDLAEQLDIDPPQLLPG